MILLILIFILPLSASAMEITAPTVPQSGWQYMPEETDSFLDAIFELLEKVLGIWKPALAEASKISVGILSAVIVISCLRMESENSGMVLRFAGAAAVTAVIFADADAMILLAESTIQEMSAYGKLLLPVMTAAMAAQGGITTSTALYAGTAFFSALLGNMLSSVFVPLVYGFLALSVAESVSAENMLHSLRDFLKNAAIWMLKTLVTVFTTYMGITGVVSGTTDAVALKAARVTISSMVPVVGGILSDASEAVLVGAGVMKNVAGIYGILAVLALFLAPFLRIGIHYLMLKATAGVCAVLGDKAITGLVENFAAAMGMLLAITGSMCFLLLVSTVCFMKGVT